MHDGAGALDRLVVIGILEGTGDKKLELAVVGVFGEEGGCLEAGSLGIGAERAVDRPAVLEKDEGDMGAKLRASVSCVRD